MARLTEAEPAPKQTPDAWAPTVLPEPTSSLDLTRLIRSSDRRFLDVLNARQSRAGGRLNLDDLSAVLWHATLLRDRWPGRFGLPAESRSAPSAGGLHSIRILCLPLSPEDSAGLYEPDRHRLLGWEGLELARPTAATLAFDLTGASTGTMLQFAADEYKIAACYYQPASLIWRDAGALAATVALVATAVGLEATLLGHHGDALVQSAGFGPTYRGVGGVLLGSPP